jgi:hypothetical protein
MFVVLFAPSPSTTGRAPSAALAAALVLTKLTAVAWFPGLLIPALLARPPLRQRARAALLAAALTLGVWAAANAVRHGDPLATRDKVAFLGWKPQPVAAWLQHPILTPAGAATFWRDAVVSFWRGDRYWRGVKRIEPAADAAVVAVTSLALLAPLVGWAARRARRRIPTGCELPDGRGLALPTAWILSASAFGLLAFCSVRFDFGDCFFPSRAYPYMTAGRLVSSAALPLLAVVAAGFDRWAAAAGRPRTAAVALAGFAMLLAGAHGAWIARFLPSAYNLFHLGGC